MVKLHQDTTSFFVTFWFEKKVLQSNYSGYLKGRPSYKMGFLSIYLSNYLSIYRRVTIIYANIMHVIDTFTKTRRRSTKTDSLLSNGRLRGGP